MKDFIFLKHNEFQRIAANRTLTRIGDLARDNLSSLVSGLISEENAVFRGGNFENPSGWTFELEASGFFIQKKDTEQVYCIAQQDKKVITVDAAHATLDRYDLIEARYSVTDENASTVDIIDPSTGTLTQQSKNIDRRIELEVQVTKGTAGAGVAPSLTGGDAATITGIPVITTVDLSTNYNLKFDIDESGSPVTIDCRGGTPSATTIAEVIALINAAGFGVIATNDGSDHLVITSTTVGGDSHVTFYPSTADDALNDLLGLTIIPNYEYDYVGGVAFFKLGEIRTQGGSANLVSADLRDVDDRGSWTADVNNIIRLEDLRTFQLNAGNLRLTAQAVDVGASVKDPVYYNNSTGKWENASFANPPSAMYTDSSSNEVTLRGWKSGLSGFIANTWYYMDSSGNLTTSRTKIQIGYAASTTDFIVDIQIDNEDDAIYFGYFYS